MSETSKQYPLIEKILVDADANSAIFAWPSETVRQVAAELRALLTERDALKAAQPKPPVRKLREVKGVTYQDGRWWYNDFDYRTVSSLIARWNVTFTDADHAAIYALKADPFEPVESVEDVLRDAMRSSFVCGGAITPEMVAKFAARLRAACAAEGAR